MKSPFTRRQRILFSARWMIVCTTVLTAPAALADAWLIRDGRPLADIVTAEVPTRGARLAAAELQAGLRRITGATLPIVTAPGADVENHVYVGCSPWAEAQGATDAGLGRDSYRIASGENWLALLGNDTEYRPSEPWCKSRADRPRMQAEWEKRTGRTWRAYDQSSFKAYNAALDIWAGDGVGSLYAVYDFLRSQGMEWYLPGPLGEIAPSRSGIPLPDISRQVAPAVPYRSITFVNFFEHGTSVVDNVRWFFQLGLGAHPQGFGHSMQVILGDPNTRTNHPDYYALYHGKRDFFSRGGKPCLSSEGFFNEMLAYTRAFFDTYPAATAFPIMPTDGFSHLCQCGQCRGRDTPERGYAGSLSDYVWGFVNRIAVEIDRSHPGRKIGCCPYTTYYLPPENVALHTNVIAMICRWRQNDAGNPEGRAQALAVRRAWQEKLAPGSLYTWDYYLNHRPGRASLGLPIFFPRLIAEDLRSWKGILQGEGVEAWKVNGVMANPGLNHLNIFVTARFYWDPDQDLDALLSAYYERFFGPAAEPMRAFYETSERTWTRLAATDIEAILGHLARAETAAATDAQALRRVLLIRDECLPALRQLLLQRNSKEVYATLALVRLPGDPGLQLDGQLLEPLWLEAEEQTLRNAASGESPVQPTAFRAAADATHLYLGISCREDAMDSLRISATDHDDMNVWLDDAVELILKTPEHAYYQFAINAAGVLADVDQKQGLAGLLWDSGAEVAAQRAGQSWTLEVRIPWKAIRGAAPTTDAPWHLNVGRSRPRDEGAEVSIFVPAGKPTFHDISKMATLTVSEPTGE